MGSFKVSCAISNLSISEGEKVKFLFLKKNKSNIKNTTSIVNCNDIFEPVYLPITGEYNGYGALNNIIRDCNVDLIEKDLGADIEQIVNDIERIVGRVSDFLSLEELFDKYDIRLVKDLNVYCESAKTIKVDDGFEIHYNSYTNLRPISYKLNYELMYSFVQGIVEHYDKESKVPVGKEVYYIGKKAKLIDNITCNLLVPLAHLSKILLDRIDYNHEKYDLKGLEHIFKVERGLIERQGRRYNFFA